MSGYKLNISKAQVLAFNCDPTGEVSEKYQLKWDADSIKYLGVHLPKKLSISKIHLSIPKEGKIGSKKYAADRKYENC